MKSRAEKLKRVIFIFVVICLSLELFSITIGQSLPIEFIEFENQRTYLDFVMYSFPILVLFTLVYTLKAEKTKQQNTKKIFSTLILSMISFLVVGFFCFFNGFGVWVDQEILYENKNEFKFRIVEQVLDNGALGTSGSRRVVLIPVCGFWNYVKHVEKTR
jgi:magnesium-transporting ATPase (P-type)